MQRRRLLTALPLMALIPGCANLFSTGPRARNEDEDLAGRKFADPRLREVMNLSAEDQFHLRLTNLRIALKLAPEQASHWQTFEQTVLGIVAAAQRRNKAAEPVDSRQRQAVTEQLAAAAQSLRVRLSDTQQQVADHLLPETLSIEKLYPVR